MNTRKLDESSRLLGSTSWHAIITGVVIALAVNSLLLLFGLAIGLSVGDNTVAGGYALWAVIVQLGSLVIGAAIAAHLSHAGRIGGGIAAGVMVWALALVFGGVLPGLAMSQRIDATGAWAAFFGAALGLGAAIAGGVIGANLGHSTRGQVTSQPIGTSYT